jgi:hypothetical protein
MKTKYIPTFEAFVSEEIEKSLSEGLITKKDWDKASEDQREKWLSGALDDPDDVDKYIDADWNDLPDVATSNMMK